VVAAATGLMSRGLGSEGLVVAGSPKEEVREADMCLVSYNIIIIDRKNG